MSDSDGLIKLFVRLVWAIWDEIAKIPNSKQRLSAKLNAIFGLLAAVIILILAIPSWLEELAGLIRALRGGELPGNDLWATIVGFIFLLVYFFACVLITLKGTGGPPPTQMHRGA